MTTTRGGGQTERRLTMNDILSQALEGFIGPLRQLMINLLGPNGPEWGEELKKFLRKEPTWSAPKILQFVSEVVVPATSQFVRREKFVVATSASAEVKISWIGGNFSSWFLAGDGKVEEVGGETTLLAHRLTERSTDGPIIAELGGEKVAETTLVEMFALLKKQGRGQEGTLLTNRYANVFYIRDRANVLRTVDCYWHGVGWGVGAYEVSRPYPWGVGYQIFSRR